MEPGQAREGDRVFFAQTGVFPEDPPMQILAGKVTEIIWRGTTNEYFFVECTSADGRPRLVGDKGPGGGIVVQKNHSECFSTTGEAVMSARVMLREKLDEIQQQLCALGDHEFAPSRWKGD